MRHWPPVLLTYKFITIYGLLCRPCKEAPRRTSVQCPDVQTRPTECSGLDACDARRVAAALQGGQGASAAWAKPSPPVEARPPARARPLTRPGGHAAGRGTSARRRRPSRRPGRPPLAHAGTARRRVRPDSAHQAAWESGQQKDHPLQPGLFVQARPRLWRSDTSSCLQDQRLAAAPPSPWPAGRRLGQTRGGRAGPRPQGALLRPPKQPGGQALARAPLTHGACHQPGKRWRMVPDRSRRWQEEARKGVRKRGCARPN